MNTYDGCPCTLWYGLLNGSQWVGKSVHSTVIWGKEVTVVTHQQPEEKCAKTTEKKSNQNTYIGTFVTNASAHACCLHSPENKTTHHLKTSRNCIFYSSVNTPMVKVKRIQVPECIVKSCFTMKHYGSRYTEHTGFFFSPSLTFVVVFKIKYANQIPSH